MSTPWGLPRLMLVLMAVPLLLLLTSDLAGGVGISWDVVDRAGHAIDVFRNSHCTAAATLAKYHGLQRDNESDRTLVATMWVYMQHCDCDKPGRPIVWQVAEGLRKFFTARAAGGAQVKELCRYAPAASNKADFRDYMRAIDRNQPVLLTYCYDPAARQGLGTARRRVNKCFTVLGIGYMRYGDRKLVICHDGITSGDAAGPAAADRVAARALGIGTRGKPWGERGTALYRWDGSYENLVTVFVSM